MAGDARLGRLIERYGSDVVPGSKLAPAASSTRPKRPKTSAKKAPGARLARPDDLQVIKTQSPRLVGYARASTDAQNGCAIVHEDSASGASRSRPGLDRAIADLTSAMRHVCFIATRGAQEAATAQATITQLRGQLEVVTRQRDNALAAVRDMPQRIERPPAADCSCGSDNEDAAAPTAAESAIRIAVLRILRTA